MGWKKITVEIRDEMTDEQQIFHLTFNPHENYGAEPQDWASMTRAKRSLLHRRMHMENRQKAVSGQGHLIPHAHRENTY